jgi:hypoxanthine phosphoribosyltransferase
MKEIQILDKKFREFISEQDIQERIKGLAVMINNDYKNKEVIFIGILNGAFMFAADLFKRIDIKAKISFLKLASYSGTNSSGDVKNLIGCNDDLKDKSVIIIEDIVDTGITLEYIINGLKEKDVKDIKVASLLLKPEAYRKSIPVDYTGFEIPDNFVVGYGLDYEGFGRNLSSIYTLL